MTDPLTRFKHTKIKQKVVISKTTNYPIECLSILVRTRMTSMDQRKSRMRVMTILIPIVMKTRRVTTRNLIISGGK